MTQMDTDKNRNRKQTYLYGQQPAEVTPAAAVKGVLIRSFNGEIAFRVYHDHERFTDYEIRHNDLSVTIAEDELAAFYKIGDNNILDHSPEVLGLKKNGEPRMNANGRELENGDRR